MLIRIIMALSSISLFALVVLIMNMCEKVWNKILIKKVTKAELA